MNSFVPKLSIQILNDQVTATKLGAKVRFLAGETNV